MHDNGSALSVSFVTSQLSARVPGGTGRYTIELLRALAQERPDPNVTLVGVGGRHRSAQLPSGVHVKTRLPPNPLLARLWERGLPPRVLGDVVHAPTLLVPPVGRRSRLVVTIHDVVPWTHPETMTVRGARFHVAMGRRAASKASLIVTPTVAVARSVEELLTPDCRVVAVSPGLAALKAPRDASARVTALLGSSEYVLFVGTAEPRKGLDVLIDAMRALPQVILAVVGPAGWGDVDVAELARRAGVQGRVLVLGHVDEANLASLYSTASAVAVPSRAEGFGLPVIEALSFGVPVVTTDDPALVEVGGGVTTVVPVDDAVALAGALAEALDSASHTDRGHAARQARAGAFSWQQTARMMWQLYHEIA